MLRAVNTEMGSDSSVDVDRVEENERETGRVAGGERGSTSSGMSRPRSRMPPAVGALLSGGGGGGRGMGGIGNLRTGPFVILRK